MTLSAMKNNYTIDWKIPHLDKTKCASQIEDFVINAIKSKTLHAGDTVPPYRELATLNNVSDSSVRRAYTKLTDGNWLSSTRGSGTFVSVSNPTESITPKKSGFTEHFPAGLAFLNKREEQLASKHIRQPFTGVGTDFPSPASFPEHKFSEYYNRHREASRNLSQAELLNAYDADHLKDALIEHLNRKRDFGLKHNMIDVIRGRKNCLDRVFKVLISPGDVVINTSPYDVRLSAALEKREARVYTVSRSEEDFIERIKQVLAYTKVRAIHIRPQCSFPEGFELSTENCETLIKLARKHRVCIIEEEDEHEFWYGSTPYRPLACYDHDGYVIYMGALSKATPDTIALRLIIASSQFINELHALPNPSIENRDVIKEKAIADMILNGDMADYARQIRLKSKAYRDELDIVLNNHLGRYLNYEVPENGLTFWLKFKDNIDLNILLGKLEGMGIPVPYHPNNQKTSEKVNYMMLGFGAFDINEAEGAAKMLNMIIEDMDISEQ